MKLLISKYQKYFNLELVYNVGKPFLKNELIFSVVKPPPNKNLSYNKEDKWFT